MCGPGQCVLVLVVSTVTSAGAGAEDESRGEPRPPSAGPIIQHSQTHTQYNFILDKVRTTNKQAFNNYSGGGVSEYVYLKY